jgi:hypothetical protein
MFKMFSKKRNNSKSEVMTAVYLNYEKKIFMMSCEIQNTVVIACLSVWMDIYFH